MKYPIPSRVPLPTPRPDQPAWAGPQAFPPRPMAPQMPMQGGNRFMDFLRNNSEALGASSAGLLSGRTGPEQFGMGMQGFSQVRGAAKEKAEEKRRKNATIEWLRQNAPEYADAVDQGVLSAGDAYKMKLQAQTPKQFDPTDDIREYQFAQSQGFEGSFQDFMTQMKKAGATNINMPGQPNIGTIPQGFQAIQDPQTGAYRMERIPGGPEDQSANKAAQFEQERQKATTARTAIKSIREKIDNGGMLDLPEVGVIGSRLAGINQEATDVKNSLATLQSIVSFDRLQAMREASPTGGALGAVSERELALLQSSLGALSQDSSPEQLRQTLDFIDGVMAKFEAYPTTAQNAASVPGRGRTSSGITFTVEP
jgi:hypothetical protein